MDKALYIAMTGAKHTMHAQTIHSNNLANVSTNGFKADLVAALSREGMNTAALDTRDYPVVAGISTNFKLGSLVSTERDLDIAVDGEGWLAVQGPEQETYAKSGRLQIDALGALRDERGYQVLGNAGPIVIPEFEKLEIGADGTISVRALGQGPEALIEVDRVKLVSPDNADLYKAPDGLIYSNREKEPLDATLRIRQGFVESSNVNAVEELTNIMSLARHFEMQVSMMQTFGDMSDNASSLVRLQV